MPVEEEETPVQEGDDFHWEVWTYSEGCGCTLPCSQSQRKEDFRPRGRQTPNIFKVW